MIILVTGSSDWPIDDGHFIWAALGGELSLSIRRGEQMQLWHRQCQTGADNIASSWLSLMKASIYGRWVYERPFPAWWWESLTGSICGHEDMVARAVACQKAGAIVKCLAYIKDGSPGATHCRDAALAAGVPTRTWTLDQGRVYPR